MSLNKLCLFKNVKITPDYSVVHDMDIETWKNYLLGWLDPMPADSDTPEIVLSQTVNYYRMPEVIRVEGNYDAIRKATYGFLEDGRHEGNETLRTSFKVLFFWVKDVRLLKQAANVDNTDPSDPLWKDVCELDVELDVWSTYAGCFELFDSYIERRHMPRWENKGTEQVPDWQPIYYPNAAQGIETAYEKENNANIRPPVHKTNPFLGEDCDIDVYLAVITYVNNSGQLVMIVLPGCYAVHSGVGRWVMCASNGQVGSWHRYCGIFAILDSRFYTALGISAEFVQSISVVKAWSEIYDSIAFSSDGCVIFRQPVGFESSFTVDNTTWYYLTVTDADHSLNNPNSLSDLVKTREYSVTPVAPDHSHIEGDGTGYDEQHEPMMYYAPARVRKVTAALGGEVFEIPDIASLKDKIYQTLLVDMTGVNICVSMDEVIADSNALGTVGMADSATMPIYNSAWRSYEAISKVSDTMQFNAKQLQTVGTGLGGSALSAAGGFMMGGPGGAVLGLASGILGTVSGVYGNDVELQAKQTQIKNSPCTMKSGGSGLTAVFRAMLDFYYLTLKADDVSMDKLRYMYYWFGYHVNRSFKGIIDLETREVFDFIKTSGAKVKGDISAGEAKQLAAIFDKGVTIYHGKDGYAKIGDGTMWNNDEV